jgi:hypothetical protein
MVLTCQTPSLNARVCPPCCNQAWPSLHEIPRLTPVNFCNQAITRFDPLTRWPHIPEKPVLTLRYERADECVRPYAGGGYFRRP